jgi:hypothetical protein
MRPETFVFEIVITRAESVIRVGAIGSVSLSPLSLKSATKPKRHNHAAVRMRNHRHHLELLPLTSLAVVIIFNKSFNDLGPELATTSLCFSGPSTCGESGLLVLVPVVL